MARILGIGSATLDIINEVEHYPAEDDEVRALHQQVRRGGNASNTLVVLSQLGHHCRWGGVLVDEPDGQRIAADLRANGVELTACRWHRTGKVPTSYITLSRANGSRTIVHHRELPEYASADFARQTLTGLDWVHFEARAIPELERMLDRLRTEQPALPCSLEVEKPRPGVEGLFGIPDVLLFSRVYARSRGFEEPAPCLDWARTQAPQARLFLGWGAAGAWAVEPGGDVQHAPAEPPPRLVETLGAGDVFNAAVIDALACRRGMREALAQAVRLAGRKCGQHGFEGLARNTKGA